MAIARKCDRCGKLYEQYNHIELEDKIVNGIYTVENKVNNRHVKHHYDLCEECCWELLIWLQNPQMTIERKVQEEKVLTED